nr:immunoglobulin light chain junction region [Macaca mulatta]
EYFCETWDDSLNGGLF